MPLGIATRIIADDTLLLDAAIANFAAQFEEVRATNPEITIRLRWNDYAADEVGFSVAVEGSSLQLRGAGARGWADARRRTAECELARGSLEVGEVAETLLLFLLTRCGRPPIHAAAVMICDTAVLLAGPSGSGKSSLALAAQRQSLEVLSEDTTYVQANPLRAWGWPGPIHLLAPDAPPGAYSERLRGGRSKLAIPVHRPRLSADKIALVAIERGERLGLERASCDWLVERLAPVEPGFDLLREPIKKALGQIAADGGWRMTLDDSPDRAIAMLRERFA
jgi:hypothetical protein